MVVVWNADGDFGCGGRWGRLGFCGGKCAGELSVELKELCIGFGALVKVVRSVAGGETGGNFGDGLGEGFDSGFKKPAGISHFRDAASVGSKEGELVLDGFDDGVGKVVDEGGDDEDAGVLADVLESLVVAEASVDGDRDVFLSPMFDKWL